MRSPVMPSSFTRRRPPSRPSKRADSSMPDPTPPLTAAPSPIAPVPSPGPAAWALHPEAEVVVRHGPSAEVRAWLARLQARRSADTALPTQIFEFPATMLGIQAINARLRNAFLGRRLLWGAGP